MEKTTVFSVVIELGEFFFIPRSGLGDRAGERNKNATNDEQKKKKKEIFSRFDRTWAEDESLRLCLAKRKRVRERLEMCARELHKDIY
jgi:hypothetical protein